MIYVAAFQEQLLFISGSERKRQAKRKAEFLAQFPRDRVVSITNATLEEKGNTYASVTYVYYE